MKIVGVVAVVAVVLSLRIALYRARRRRRRDGGGGRPARRSLDLPTLESALGDVGLVAGREIRERVRGRIFRIGTLVILVAVAAVIVIPTLDKTTTLPQQKVGVVGTLSPQVRQVVEVAGRATREKVVLAGESSRQSAAAALRSGKLDVVIVNSTEMLVDHPLGSSKSHADVPFVDTVAEYLGVLQAYERAGLTTAQRAVVSGARPVPVTSLTPGGKSAVQTTSVIGLVLLFIMLTQYCTWTLIGVLQEKSSRVVEVLLSTVRPIQLLGGKVLGIGLVAMGQAALIVGVALAIGAAVGSDLLHGAAPIAVLAELLWLLLGYAFYSWVYAAAGSTAERQDQVQTLALPLSLPVLFGYVYSITVASSGGTPSLFFKVLAYFPPTAPFCMSVLVGLRQATWWEFLASTLLSLAGTVAVAVFAARIYRRAVLRTGGRVRLAELVGRPTAGRRP